jgi:hypothetical protein
LALRDAPARQLTGAAAVILNTCTIANALIDTVCSGDHSEVFKNWLEVHA